MACKIPSPSVTPQALLNAILCVLKAMQATGNGSSPTAPPEETTDIELTYVGGVPATDDARIETVTYLNGATVLKIVTLTYVGSTNNIDTVNIT